MKRFPLLLALMTAGQFPAAFCQEPAVNASRVTVNNGRISITAREVPLRQILDEIRQAANVSFSVFPGADAELISAVIGDAPIEQGLRALLGRYDFFFLYSARNMDGADLKKVWIYQKGQGAGLEPASAEAVAGTKELREKLSDPDRGVRARAFEALLARPGLEEQEAIARAVLSERDDSLRAKMIESVRSSSLNLPPEFWGSLSNDPSEHVRMLVLDALEGTSQVRSFATLALSDPSDHIKLRAREILDALGAASASGCGSLCGPGKQ